MTLLTVKGEEAYTNSLSKELMATIGEYLCFATEEDFMRRIMRKGVDLHVFGKDEGLLCGVFFVLYDSTIDTDPLLKEEYKSFKEVCLGNGRTENVAIVLCPKFVEMPPINEIATALFDYSDHIFLIAVDDHSQGAFAALFGNTLEMLGAIDLEEPPERRHVCRFNFEEA